MSARTGWLLRCWSSLPAPHILVPAVAGEAAGVTIKAAAVSQVHKRLAVQQWGLACTAPCVCLQVGTGK